MPSIRSILNETAADEPFDATDFFIGPSNTDDLTTMAKSFESLASDSITDGTNNKVFRILRI